jgi:hypothetical protein
MSKKTRYLVESTFHTGVYATKEPEEAVEAFFCEHLAASGAKVKVSVVDFIGEFKRETNITRLPREQPITRPDSPSAIAAKPAP